MAATSLEAVKRKIKLLQDQADGAEERAEKLQRELALERKAREAVRTTNDTKCQVHVLKCVTFLFQALRCACVHLHSGYDSARSDVLHEHSGIYQTPSTQCSPARQIATFVSRPWFLITYQFLLTTKRRRELNVCQCDYKLTLVNRV